MADESGTLMLLTADIVSAHVSNNSVAVGDIAVSIRNVYDALTKLAAPAQPPQAEKPRGAVSVRASLKPDHLVSMIDGKPYKMLRRHLGQHGHTPESYREAYGLPRDYPMVAADYAARRRALALEIGLGRKSKTGAASRSAKPIGKPRTPKR